MNLGLVIWIVVDDDGEMGCSGECFGWLRNGEGRDYGQRICLESGERVVAAIWPRIHCEYHALQ